MPSYAFIGDTNTGMSAPMTDTLVLSTNGIERLSIGSTGEASFTGPITTPESITTTAGDLVAATGDAIIGATLLLRGKVVAGSGDCSQRSQIVILTFGC